MGSLSIRVFGALIVLSALALAAPAPARAGDCAGNYVFCLNGDFVSSDAFHEQECWGDYIACLRRLILVV